MECNIYGLFPSVRKINVSTLTPEGALGIDNGRCGAFHLEVTGSALPHVGCHLQHLPSAPMGGPSSRPSWSQRAPRAASVGNGMDLLGPAPDVTAAPALGSDRAPPGNLTFCHTCTTHEWRTCYPCPVQNNSFEEQDTTEHKSVCYKVGCGFPWLPPVPAEFH